MSFDVASRRGHDKMGNTAKRVGVIGAGVSGVAAAAYLKAAGLEVTIFERSSVAGGVWYVSRKSYSWLLMALIECLGFLIAGCHLSHRILP